MKIRFDKARWMEDSAGMWLCFRLTHRIDVQNLAPIDTPYIADIKKDRAGRSLNANNYMWVLCQKISEAVGSIGKDDVYRQAIRQIGLFDYLPIRNDALDEFRRRWESKGTGWLADVDRESKMDGYTVLCCYYGSSTYNTKEMSAVIDYLVAQAQDLGIETMTPEELSKLIGRWSNAQADKGVGDTA